MAFVHRERRKVGEVTPTTGAHVGPGAYLALVSRAGVHGYAPFASTERRTLDAGNVGLLNRTPGPGSFDAAEAAASVQERKGGAGRFGKDSRGLETGENAPRRASPGPADYALEADGWRSRQPRVARSVAGAPGRRRGDDDAATKRRVIHEAHSGDENEKAGHVARRRERTRRGDDGGPRRAATVSVDETTGSSGSSKARAPTPTAKTRSSPRRDAFFTAPAIDPDSLSTDPFDPAPLRAMPRGSEPSRGEMLVEEIRRRHVLATRVSASAAAAAAAAAAERPDAAALRRRREAERRARLEAVRDTYRHRDDAFVGVPGSRDARLAADDADAASRVAGAAGKKTEAPAPSLREKEAFPPPVFPPAPAPPLGGSSKMGHQLASAPSPGPGAYAEKPETFSEEVSKALGGAKAKRSAAERPRSTRGGVPLSAFGPASSETKKPFLFAAARFGSDSTFVPGPGAYGRELRGAENLENLGRESRKSERGAGARGAGFGEGARRTRVDANAVGRLVLREGRFVRFDGAYDDTDGDEHGNERETRLKQAEDAAKIRYARAGGGFAHGVWDAAGSARLAAAEAAAAAERRRTAFAPGARAAKPDAAGPGPGAYSLPDAWVPPAGRRVFAGESSRARSGSALRTRAGRLGESAAATAGEDSRVSSHDESLESLESHESLTGRSTDADEANLRLSVERWHAFDEAKTPTRARGAVADASADAPGPGTYDAGPSGPSGSFPKGTSAPFRSASARFGSSRTPAPGPGHYEPRKPGEDMNKRSFNATVDGAPNAFRGELAP